MKMIIGVSGKLGSGKDYITSNVIIPVLEKYNTKYMQINFADQLKVNVMTKYNVKYCDVYEKKTLESRKLLQNEGTAKKLSDINVWIKFLANWINVYNQKGINIFVISDVRFKEEYEYVKNNNGLMIKIVAPERNMKRLLEESKGNLVDMNDIRCHRSECDLDSINDSMYDLVIKNDGVIDVEHFKDIFENLVKKIQ